MGIIFKLQAVIVLISLSINFSSSSNFTCNLDDMKLFAAEACENIFIENDADIRENDMRDKREIWNSKYNKNGYGESKHHPKFAYKSHLVEVRRKDYPQGGFIRINRLHAKLLTYKDNAYKIFERKNHNKLLNSISGGDNHKGYRGKRQNFDNIIHIPYCCTNNCRTDFFCRR